MFGAVFIVLFPIILVLLGLIILNIVYLVKKDISDGLKKVTRILSVIYSIIWLIVIVVGLFSGSGIGELLAVLFLVLPITIPAVINLVLSIIVLTRDDTMKKSVKEKNRFF